MKCGFLALTVLLLIAGAFPQEGKTTEPEYFSVFYYLQTPAEFVELERQSPSITPKSGKVLYSIPGERSPVRLNAKGQIQFVVRAAEDFDEARQTIQLFRFEAADGRRRLLMKGGQSGLKAANLKLNAERYASSSLKLAPIQELAPGEYCLSRTTISQGFCFGIDAPGKIEP